MHENRDLNPARRLRRAVVPVLPDAPESSDQPPRRRWRKVLGAVLLGTFVAVVIYAAYLIVSVAKISDDPFRLGGLNADSDGRTNVLVLGVGDSGHSAENLSDSMMVLSVNRRTKQVAQISLPRDLRVKIPGHGSGKINSANAYGGEALAAQVVSNTLGIPIHSYVKTNFTGLKHLVDSVGGIDVLVKDHLVDRDYPCEDNQYKVCGLDIQPGLQHMDGMRALQYARCRKGTCGNDFGRAARQQEVVDLVRDKAMQPEILLDPRRLLPLVTAVGGGVQTDMSAWQLAELAWSFQEGKKRSPVSLVLSTGNGGYLRSVPGTSDLTPIDGDFSGIQTRVQNIFK